MAKQFPKNTRTIIKLKEKIVSMNDALPLCLRRGIHVISRDNPKDVSEQKVVMGDLKAVITFYSKVLDATSNIDMLNIETKQVLNARIRSFHGKLKLAKVIVLMPSIARTLEELSEDPEDFLDKDYFTEWTQDDPSVVKE